MARALIRSRAAFLVSGGTGSGKTSILGALLGIVPERERIVIVEDTCELDPEHPHVVSLEARPANLEGQGEIPLRMLVRQALRMRPDRLVVGEVRGAEVVDLLAAMNTGHEGGCGTVHANSAAAVPDRLAALALAAGMTLSGVHAQASAGLDVVVHLARQPDGTRVVAELGVVTRGADGTEVRRRWSAGRGHCTRREGSPAGRTTREPLVTRGGAGALRGVAAAGAVLLLWPTRPVPGGTRPAPAPSRVRGPPRPAAPARPAPDPRVALGSGGRARRWSADRCGAASPPWWGWTRIPARGRWPRAVRAWMWPMPCAPTRAPPERRRCVGWLPAGRWPSGRAPAWPWRCPALRGACGRGPRPTPSSTPRLRPCAPLRAFWPGCPCWDC